MHLPQLLSAESVVAAPYSLSIPLNNMDIECSHNLMKLTSDGGGIVQQETFNGDYHFLDKLLASHHNVGQLCQSKLAPPPQVGDIGSSVERFPFQYLGCEADFLKFSKWDWMTTLFGVEELLYVSTNLSVFIKTLSWVMHIQIEELHCFGCDFLLMDLEVCLAFFDVQRC